MYLIFSNKTSLGVLEGTLKKLYKEKSYCSLTSLTLAVKLCAKKIKQPRIQPFAEGEL